MKEKERKNLKQPSPSVLSGALDWEMEKASASCRQSNNQDIVCYQGCFGHQCKTQHHTGCYEEN